MRWAAAAWLAVWLPAYASVWGPLNFLHLCDVAVILTCAGLWLGTEYMWDASFPLAVRLLSLFHVAWPALLLWALRRVGYDRRGFALQIAIAGALFVVSRFAGAAANLNFAFRDPIWGLSLEPAALHLAATLAFIVAVFYLPVHVALSRGAELRR